MGENKKTEQTTLIIVFILSIIIFSSLVGVFKYTSFFSGDYTTPPLSETEKKSDYPFNKVYFPQPNRICDISWRPQGDWAFVITESCIFKTDGYTNDYLISFKLVQGNFSDLKKCSWAVNGDEALVIGSNIVLSFNGTNFTNISCMISNFYDIRLHDVAYNIKDGTFYIVGRTMEEGVSKGLLLIYDGNRITKKIYSSEHASSFVDIEFNEDFSFALIGDWYGKIIKLSSKLDFNEIFSNDTFEIKDVALEDNNKAFFVGRRWEEKKYKYDNKEFIDRIYHRIFYKIEYSPESNRWLYENITAKLPNNKFLNTISFTPTKDFAIILGEDRLALKYADGCITDISSSCEELGDLYFISFNSKGKYGLIVGEIGPYYPNKSAIIKYENNNFKIIFEGFASYIIDLTFNSKKEFFALAGSCPNYIWKMSNGNYTLYADFPTYNLWNHYISHGRKSRISYSSSGDFVLVLDQRCVYKIENDSFTIIYNKPNGFIDLCWIPNMDCAYIIDSGEEIYEFDGQCINFVYKAEKIGGGGLRTLSISDDGKIAIFGGQSETIVVKNDLDFEELSCSISYVFSIIWLPDSHIALIGDQRRVLKYEDGNVTTILDMEQRSPIFYRVYDREYILIQTKGGKYLGEIGMYLYYNFTIYPLNKSFKAKIYSRNDVDMMYIYDYDSDYLYRCNRTVFEKYLEIDEIING